VSVSNSSIPNPVRVRAIKIPEVSFACVSPSLSPIAYLLRKRLPLGAAEGRINESAIGIENVARFVGCEFPRSRARNLDVDHSLTPSLHPNPARARRQTANRRFLAASKIFCMSTLFAHSQFPPPQSVVQQVCQDPASHTSFNRAAAALAPASGINAAAMIDAAAATRLGRRRSFRH